MSSGSDAFRAFSFCLPFFHLPRDASQFPLPLNRRRRRRRRSRRRLLIRFFIWLSPSLGRTRRRRRRRRLAALSKKYQFVELLRWKGPPGLFSTFMRETTLPSSPLSSLIAPPHLSRAANVPRHRSFRKDKSELILRPGSSFDKVERGAIGGATIKPLIALNREFFF